MSRFINLLGPLFTRAFKPGASEVKALRHLGSGTTTTRATMITPTSGKKIRIVSVQMMNTNADSTEVEVYFGTGTNITTNAGKEISAPRLDGIDMPSYGLSWPDGGGPVGVVDEVVSVRTGTAVGASMAVTTHYREE